MRRNGINSFSAPHDPGDHSFYHWMRIGFSTYASLSTSYPLYRAGSPAGTAAEIFPHASAALLAGKLHATGREKESLRRRVLGTHDVDDSDPPSVDRVDAALSALTGTLALEGTYTTVGNPDEGVILLPGRNLPRWPLERALPPWGR